MDIPAAKRTDVDDFITEEIESVPHLEALLLVWNSRPRRWSAGELAKDLYLSADQAEPIREGEQEAHRLN